MSKNASEEKPDKSLEINDLICFAIYTASTAMNRAYQPYLSKLGMTYPQYITMSALWQGDEINVGSLCKRLMMETNTLTPILQRLEKRNLITREKGVHDERQVILRLTGEGDRMRSHQQDITNCVVGDTDIDIDALDDLVKAVGKLRDNLIENNN